MPEEQPARQIAIGSYIAQALGQGAKATINIFRGTTAEQRALRNRYAMLQLVRSSWVKGVLEQSLHGAAMIELGLEERADAVERPWDMVLQTPDQLNRQLPPGTKIVDVFDDMNQALLILGEPGSGKTTMLLELARDTIARAEEDPMQPIPVVFNLSSWAEKRQPIAEWLVEELNIKYNIPKRIARPWVENDDLLLLLDGLDEVKQNHREACVKAINDFRQEYGLTPLVVCSRVADYEALTTRLGLQGAILLQPLTPQQVEVYFAGTGAELSAVRETLQRDTTLQELARSPLMLSTMVLAYQDIPVRDLLSLDSIETRRKHVFDAYVQRMFRRRGTGERYSLEQTICWLAWLARGMSKRAKSIFQIDRMQLHWLQTPAQKRRQVVIVKWIAGLIGVLILGLAGGLIGWEIGTWSDTLIGGLIGGLVGGLLGRNVEVTTIPNQSIRWVRTNSIIRGLFVGLFVGLFAGLLIGLVGGAIGGLKSGLLFAWIGVLLVGPLTGLVHGLDVGGVAAIQYFTLRLLLYRNGYTPWTYTRFLDYAVERIFLRKVGSGYIFIHRLLMEYFATLKPGQVHVESVTSIVLNLSWKQIASILLIVGITLATASIYGPILYYRTIAEICHLRGNHFVDSSDWGQALRDYTRATELYPDNAQYWNSLCWFGSLSGHAADVMYACEQAVELAPDHGVIRDSRGLARALTGDYEGAIEDFESYVEWSKEKGQYEPRGPKREVWIEELEAGQSPFDEATLEELLNE